MYLANMFSVFVRVLGQATPPPHSTLTSQK